MSTALNFPPMPIDPIAEVRAGGDGTLDAAANPNMDQGRITFAWVQWFNALSNAQGNSPSRIGQLSLATQSASLGATDIGGATSSAGLYQAQFYCRVTLPASVSSSIQVSIGWTDDGVTQGRTSTAQTGNTTTTLDEGTIVIYSDAASPVTIAVAYASVGTPMEYKLYATLTKLVT